jgi:hypothetical protein
MFASRQAQLRDLDAAYQAFVAVLLGLSPQEFLTSPEGWAPRDVAAHLVGWNRSLLAGCAAVREGAVPYYFYDGLNDYREVNAGFIRRFASQDRDVLLQQLDQSMRELVAYLGRMDEAEWEQETGVIHYHGGPATVARCVDSLLRDYRNHAEALRRSAGA